MATVIGIITDVDNAEKKAQFWTKDLAEEMIAVSSHTDISMLKIGNWISVPSEEIQKRRIETFHIIDDPIPTKIRNTLKHPMKQKRICLQICIAFPPIRWAEFNGYQLLAYGENIGVIGNFAFKKLTEMNGEIERDVCYRGEIVSLSDRLLTLKYRTIWAIRAEKLDRVDNETFLSTCPWREIFDEQITQNGNKQGSLDTPLLSNSPLEEGRSSPIIPKEDPVKGEDRESSGNGWRIEQEALRGPLSMIISTDVHKDNKRKRLSSGSFIGIVVRFEANCKLIFGKPHGLVLVTHEIGLSLRLGDWVSYDCIMLEEPHMPDVRYSAIYCHELENRPCVSKTNNATVQVFTKVKMLYNNDQKAPDGFVLMTCDFIGPILAPDSADLRDAIENDKIDVVVQFDDKSYSRFSWVVTSFFKNGIPIPLSTTILSDYDELVTCNNTIDLSGQSFDHSATKVPQPELSSASCRTLDPSSTISDTALSGVDTNRRIDDAESQIDRDVPDIRNSSHQQRKMWLIDASTTSLTASQLSIYRPSNITKKVPMAILVRKSATYGVIWNFRYKSIIVSIEHLGDLCVGVWVKTKIAKVEDYNDCMEYRYMTIAPLVKIANKLPLRCQDGIIQVQVHLEIGGEFFIENKRSYFMKNSELGQVLLNDDRMHPEDQQKRFLTWATFIQHDELYPWMVPYRETLVEIDDLGNPIDEQCNIPRRYNIASTEINYEMEASNDGADEDESIHCISNEPISNEDHSPSIEDKPRDVSDAKQLCKTLNHFENQLSPSAAMRKILVDTRIQKLIIEIGYENEMNTILRWFESSHFSARRCSL